MHYIFALLFLLLASGAIAANPDHPQQWQFSPDREIHGPIDPNQCVRALYGPELEEERGGFAGQWHPPVDDQTIRWLEHNRRLGKLTLELCDSGLDT